MIQLAAENRKEFTSVGETNLIMRLSSSSPVHRLWLKRLPVASVGPMLACICLLLVPLVAGVEETEIDLKTANHEHRLDHTMDANYGHITSHSMLAKKHKQNKSHPKKYVDENVDGFHQATEKKSIYDKKYFDYLPVEQKGASEPTYEAGFVKRTNSRRLRRDTEGVVEQPRTKRQSWTMYQIPAFQTIPTIIQPGSIAYNPYHRPSLNNHYLPPQAVRPIPLPANPNQIPDRTYLPVNTPRPQQPADPTGLPAPRPTPPTARPPPPPSAPPTTTSTTSTVTTTTPRPVIQNNSDDEFDWASLGLSPDGGDNGNNGNNINPSRRAPSKCTWAIANCCSQYSDKIRYHCFEQNQCFGSFWGDNVCRTYYKLALTEIENYYNAI
nr:abl interactor homolog isoform X8 [Aedes albopictus]